MIRPGGPVRAPGPTKAATHRMAPTKAQQSGFCGERTSSGVNEPWHLCRGERYGACEDDVGADIIRPGAWGQSPHTSKKGGLGGFTILTTPAVWV